MFPPGFHYTYTSNCSDCDRARYEAQAIVHADVEGGRPVVREGIRGIIRLYISAPLIAIIKDLLLTLL